MEPQKQKVLLSGVIFDLDGMLVDSRESLLEAMVEVFATLGHNGHIKHDNLFGPPMRDFFSNRFGDGAEMEQAYTLLCTL